MLRGLYAAASAMVAQLSRQDVYANNLANVNSVGFRRGRVSVSQFPADLQAAPATWILPVNTECSSLLMTIMVSAFFESRAA